MSVLAFLHQGHLWETGRLLCVRFKQHKDSAERQGTPCLVGQHFQLPGHSTKDMVLLVKLVRGTHQFHYTLHLVTFVISYINKASELEGEL